MSSLIFHHIFDFSCNENILGGLYGTCNWKLRKIFPKSTYNRMLRVPNTVQTSSWLFISACWCLLFQEPRMCYIPKRYLSTFPKIKPNSVTVLVVNLTDVWCLWPLICLLQVIITHSWLYSVDLMEQFHCLVNEFSIILTALNSKPYWKMG